jgi:hypothetical protein
MLKNMLTKLGLIFASLFVLPTSSMAMNIFSNNDLVIIFGDVKDGDDRQLILPLFSVLPSNPIMRTFCLAAVPRTSVAQTSSG